MIRRILTTLALTLAGLACTSHARAGTNCTSSLLLYDGVNYTGPVLSTSIRWTYLNLANYGYDNRASSVRVGACPVDLFTGPWGGGAILRLYAWQQVPDLAGYRDIISSVYIY